MSKSGVNWHRVYYIYAAVYVLVGLVNNDSFRSWLLRFLFGITILAIIVEIDRDRS